MALFDIRRLEFGSRVRLQQAWTVAAACMMSACGAAMHDAIRPADPAAADATGHAQLKPVDGPSTPLVIDWQPDQRADLEEAIHDGVAIVAWDDKGLRLLKRCRLAGNYGYLPVQMKRDVVRLESADDVKANLPLGGAGIVGSIGAGFSQGTTLDIALAIVGKRRTTWTDVARDDMTGDCAEATHYVRAVTVGAFAMKTGTRTKAAIAAQIFGAGMSAGTGSNKDISSTDGKIEACDKVTGEETKPPGECAALLRIELEPISKVSTAGNAHADDPGKKPDPKVVSEIVEGCPQGFVFSKGACTGAATDRPHVCAPDNPVECDAQCTKGDSASCDRFGSLIMQGKLSTPPDLVKARAAFQKACDGDYANGCSNLGIHLAFGSARDPLQATTSLQKGCSLGSARACALSGDALLNGTLGTKDPVQALKFFVKGCDGGNFSACTDAGFLYAGGTAAVARDDTKALAYAQRACFGGSSVACGNAGYKIELGESVAADPKSALTLYDRGCKLDPRECFRGGLLLAVGAPSVPKDDTKAQPLLEKACASGVGLSSIACVVSARLYNSVGVAGVSGLDKTIATMKPQCDQKEGRACAFLGIAEFGEEKPEAALHLKAACDLKDQLGCLLATKLTTSTSGLPSPPPPVTKPGPQSPPAVPASVPKPGVVPPPVPKPGVVPAPVPKPGVVPAPVHS